MGGKKGGKNSAGGSAAKKAEKSKKPAVTGRKWLTIPALIIGWGVTALTAAGFFGGWWWGLDLAAHFRIQYALILLLWSPLTWLFFRRKWTAGVFAAACVLNAALVIPYLNHTANRPGRYRVLAANVHFLNRDLGKVERYILAQRPDFVVLTEAPWPWRYKMPNLVKAYPYCYDALEMKPSRIVICSRFKAERAYPLRSWDYNPGLFAEFRLENRNFTLVGIHPASSRLRRDHQDRLLQYRQLAYFFTQTPPGDLMVVGDFNTTPWSYYFRLLTARMKLYNSMRERGLQLSWPVGAARLLAVPIDNCIHTDGIRVTSLQLGSDLGSDHYPLLLEFDLIPAASTTSSEVLPPGAATRH